MQLINGPPARKWTLGRLLCPLGFHAWKESGENTWHTRDAGRRWCDRACGAWQRWRDRIVFAS